MAFKILNAMIDRAKWLAIIILAAGLVACTTAGSAPEPPAISPEDVTGETPGPPSLATAIPSPAAGTEPARALVCGEE